jgi:hypothetical protein
LGELNRLDVEKEVKRAKSLAKTPEGRHALREVYGLEFQVNEEDGKPVVAALVPCYKQPHPQMQSSFNQMVDFTRKSGKARVYADPLRQSSVVHWTRNELLANLIRSGKPFTHVLFIDDDIAPPQDALLKMLAHGKDIVGALCSRRQDPCIPNMRLVNMETGEFGEVWNWQEGMLLGGPGLPEGHAMAVGTGMMLISREALQKAADAFVNFDYEKLIWGYKPEQGEIDARAKRFGEKGNGWWFRFLPAKPGNEELGEDIYFCWAAKKFCDIDTYVDTSILPLHFGDYGYSITDFIAQRDEAIELAKRNGSYMPPALREASRIKVVEG